MKLMLNGKEVSGMGHYVMAGDIKDATAEPANVLAGKDFYNNNGKKTGTMPNRGSLTATLDAGGNVSIPEGYHDGTGSVKAKDIATIVSENGDAFGDATAADVASGKKFTSKEGLNMVGTGSMVHEKIFDGIQPYEYYDLGVVPKEKTLYVGILAYLDSGNPLAWQYDYFSYSDSHQSLCQLGDNGTLEVYQNNVTSAPSGSQTKVMWMELPYEFQM